MLVEHLSFVAISIVAFTALAGLGAIVALQYVANAQILERDPLDMISVGGNATTLEEIDVAIDPSAGYLPQNGSLSIDTTGANDIDIQSMPSRGETIVLTNTTATVTSNPVSIGPPITTQLQADIAEAEEESCDDEDC